MAMTTEMAGAPMTAPRGGKSQTAFRTISEVADELDVAQHVLRFWESKFPQVRPLKRGGGRRYYRPEDIDLLRDIRTLLYEEGYTIKGAQKLLRQRRARPPASPGGSRPVAATAVAGEEPAPAPAPAPLSPAVESAPSATPGGPSAALTAVELEHLRRVRQSLGTVRDELVALLAGEDD